MNFIEFFAGSAEISEYAKSIGVNTISTDIQQFGNIDIVKDVRLIHASDFPFIPDMGWFSTPCQGFSVASIGKNWTGGKNGYIPKSDSARLSIALAKKTIELIDEFIDMNPDFIFWIENPRGVLRKMDFMQRFKRFTVWYCKYGDERAKPTDIWTNCDTWTPRPMCKNYRYNKSGEIINKHCDHVGARRGAKTGTQGRDGSYERSKIPAQLIQEIFNSVKIAV